MRYDDFKQQVTDRIIAELEAGAPGEWKMPWAQIASHAAPKSATTAKPYRGVNWLRLSMEQADRGYTSSYWGSFKAWRKILPDDGDKDRRVLKGEKGDQKPTPLVYLDKWVPKAEAERAEADGDKARRKSFMKVYYVYNADQIVDPPDYVTTTPPALSEHERIEQCEQYFAAIGAPVRVGGDRAFYAPEADYISVPTLAQFPEREHYYSTLAHEHVHYTGHPSRLSRDLSGRFGPRGADAAYAMEELVAELGAAFFSAQMGIDQATRLDHTAYLAHWISVLKADPSAIVTVASKASDAIDWLNTAAAWQPQSKELEPA